MQASDKGTVKLAKNSLGIVISPLLLGVIILTLLEYFFSIRWLEYTVLLLSLAAFLFFIVFFRDPERKIPEKGIVSPADGVVSIVDEKDGRKRVAVFMNVHNVHVNRAPISGKILSVKHVSGGYLPAYRKDSERNERMYIEMETDIGRVTVVQIAGVLVRRIVTYVKEGDEVEKGQRIGMIRFGSRVDTIMPAGVKVIVNEGDGVKAGETVIALPTE